MLNKQCHGGSSSLYSLMGEEMSQEPTHPRKTSGCERGFCAFLSAAGGSRWPGAGVVALQQVQCICGKPARLLAGLGLQGVLGLFCLWNAARPWSHSWYDIPALSNEVTQTHGGEQQGASLLLGGPKDGLGRILLTLWYCYGEGCHVCLHLYSLGMDFFLL